MRDGDSKWSPNETISLNASLPLEMCVHRGTTAIIKQLQFHIACSFEGEEGQGGKSSVVKKIELASVGVLFPHVDRIPVKGWSRSVCSLHA